MAQGGGYDPNSCMGGQWSLAINGDEQAQKSVVAKIEGQYKAGMLPWAYGAVQDLIRHACSDTRY